MKKSYLLLGILASLILLAMTACSSDDELTTPPCFKLPVIRSLINN